MRQRVDEIQKCVKSGNLQAANNIFMTHLGKRSLLDLTDGADFELVAFFLQTVLPLTLHHHPSLVIDTPSLAAKYSMLLKEADSLGYAHDELKRHNLHLRCLSAIGAVLRGERERILLAAEENGIEPLVFNGDIPPEGLSYEDAESYFKRYFKRAEERKDYRLLGEISEIVFDLLSKLRREETVPGIVRGLFVDGLTGKGEIRRVLATVDLGGNSIEYATLGGEEISDALRGAAQNAWVASNSYLLNNGYMEGLKGRKISWQITDLDVKADNLRTFYDGGSMGLPLAMAIISSYLRHPVSSLVAFTGAFDITSSREGKLVRIGGALSKCTAAIEKGMRCIFIPRGNEADIDLSLRKEAEREGFGLYFIDSISSACKEIFGVSRKKSAREILLESLADFWSILTLKPRKPFLEENLSHIWLSCLLLALMYLLEGMLVYKISSVPPVPWTVFYMTVVPSCVVILIALLLSYAIAPLYLEQRKQNSWYTSMVFLGAASLITYILFLRMARGEPPELSKFTDWPPWLGILKDLFIFLAFGVLYLTDIFNYVSALDYLTHRYQVVTVQNCLRKVGLIDADIPVRLFAVSWQLALAGACGVAGLLLSFEMVTYWSLKRGLEAARWYIGFGILRDLVFLMLALELLIWYRNSLTGLKRRIMQE